MARPGWWGAALVLVSLVACAPAGKADVRVAPPGGVAAQAAGHAQVVASDAAVTEDPQEMAPGAEQLVVTVTLANIGEVPIDGLFARDGRVGWDGVDAAAPLARDAAWDPSPIAPGEQRALRFDAGVGPLGACTEEVLARPNPHHGVITVAFTLLSSAGAWALADIDAALTCVSSDAAAPPPAPPLPQSGDVEFMPRADAGR